MTVEEIIWWRAEGVAIDMEQALKAIDYLLNLVETQEETKANP